MQKTYFPKTGLIVFVLTIAIMFSGLQPANAEIDAQTFLKQFYEALEKDDFDKIMKLILLNPQTAKQVHEVLQTMDKEKNDDAAVMAELGELLGQMLAVVNAEDSGQVDMSRLIYAGEKAFDDAQYDQALSMWNQGLDLAKKAQNKKFIGVFSGAIGNVYMSLDRYDQALTYFEQALAIRREMGDRSGERWVLTKIGGVYQNLGRYDQALTYYEQALAIDREVGDRRGEGKCLKKIGKVHLNLGRYDQALTYYEQALAIHREIGDRIAEVEVIEVLSNICLLYDALGCYDQALTYYEQVLAIYREIGVRFAEGWYLSLIGLVYQNLGRYDQALTYLDQALAIHREIGGRFGEGWDLTKIGGVYWNLGRYDQALTYLDQALAIKREIGDRRDEGADLANIGLVYEKQGKYEKARRSFAQSLEIAESVGAPESLWKAHRGLAVAETQTKINDAAIDHYKQALNTIERMRAGITAKESRTAFMQDNLFVYDELITLLQDLHSKHPEKGYDRQSLEIFERKQGRILLEEMGQSGAHDFAGIPDEVVADETRLANQIAELGKKLADERSKPQKDFKLERIRELEGRLEDLQTEEQQLKAQIQKEHPDYYALKHPQPVSLKKIRTEVLKPGEMMLVYNVMQDRTCLWVVGRNHFSLHTIKAGTKKMQERIPQYRRAALNVRGGRGNAVDWNADDAKTEIFNLYGLLFPPAAQKAIAKAPTIYIIPTGPLYLLPFEALRTNSDQKPRYLIEDHAVAYLSSASLLKIIRDAQGRKKHRPQYPLLAYADPVYQHKPQAVKGKDEKDRAVSFNQLRDQALRAASGGEFIRLPETADEARAIGQILKAPEKSHPLHLQTAASRSNVFDLNASQQLDDYRYLVFACHGVIPDEVNLIKQPALVLSHPDPENQKPGFLTMTDVFGLQLNADLVALTACNTGRGEQIKGEGVMGLTRAFMYAGAPAVAVTLWSVETMSAKELNGGMFRHLNEGMSRADALRAIKLEMIQGKYDQHGHKFSDPRFWAPLVVFGDAG